MSGAPPRGAPPPTGPPLPAAAQAPQVWNHLQVPNFYPRQPQAAHMSSDRATSRSPLTWHTPTPPEHQGMKGAPNLYRHTPTPPDLQKAASNPLFRHTPTPPDRDPLKAYRHTPTPPDVQAAANASYRHTPTPPDIAHGVKGASLYRNTPPPDGHKQTGNPLMHLQQMIPDRSGSRLPDPHRDNLLMRGDALNFARLSPGLTVGSMDLSVSRSPRNGSQNGELSIPMSLSVRDASKINSLDSTEISRIHQTPGYVPKPVDIIKSASPTFNPSNPNAEAPKPTNKRPLKKVDSILERLNSATESPGRRASSPRSVIVSAHSMEDSRGCTTPLNLPVAPILGSSNSTTFEPTSALSLKIDSYRPADCPTVPTVATSTCPEISPQLAKDRLLHSVIKESSSASREESPALNCSNEDSNGSSSDSGKSRRRRKQAKTNRVDSGGSDAVDGIRRDVAPINLSETPENLTISTEEKDNSENVSSTSGSDLNPKIPEKTVHNDTDTKLENAEDANVTTSIAKTRRKTSSESETIDNIAAMIASTDSSNIENSKDPAQDLSDTGSLQSQIVADPIQTQLLSEVLSSPIPESIVELSEPQLDVKNDHLANSLESNETESSKVTESAEEPVVKDKIKSPAESSCIFEVENELEKMFAGIEETADPEKSTIDTVDDQKLTDASVATPPRSKPGRKKRISRKSSDAASSGLLSSDENTPKKKKKPVKRKSGTGNKFDADLSPIRCLSKKMNKAKPNNLKFNQPSTKDAYDSGSNASSSKSRGPYVQIRGPRDSPLSVNVINTPIQEEVLDKPLQKIKSLKNKAPLHVDRNFKKSKGLHTSTLSMKYDAMTTDTSWICVFCKKGPHTGPVRRDTVGLTNGRAQNMGDLFGPYVISTGCPDYLSMMNDPKDTLFKGKPNKQGTFMQNKQSTRGKRIKLDEVEKSNFPNEEMYYGMTEATADSYEVWLHEDCAVWAPGLYLVGAKVVGLDAAVWSCCTMRCDHCSNLGATVACIKHGCQKTMHVNCARTDLWSLSEDNFLVYCKEHKLP